VISPALAAVEAIKPAAKMLADRVFNFILFSSKLYSEQSEHLNMLSGWTNPFDS
jgi:hypothetical protein